MYHLMGLFGCSFRRSRVARFRQFPKKHIDLTLSSDDSATVQRVSIHSEESWAIQQRYNHSLAERLARSEAAFGFLCNKIEESSATQRELTRVLGEFRVTRLKPAIDQEGIASAETTMTVAENRQMRPRMRSRSELRMQTLLPLRKCVQGCPCFCHKIRRVRLPSKASALFGSGFFGFRGLPFWGTDCNYWPCKQGLGPLIVINYFLPTWLCRTMLYAWFSSAPLCPPEVLIRTYKVVPSHNLLIDAAAGGNLALLQTVLATGKISPFVLSEGEGHSLLHVRQSRHIILAFVEADYLD